MNLRPRIKFNAVDGILELPEHVFKPIGEIIALQLGTPENDIWCPQTEGLIIGRDLRPLSLERGKKNTPLYFVAVNGVSCPSIYEGVDVTNPGSYRGFQLSQTRASIKNYIRSYRAKGDNTNLIQARFEMFKEQILNLPVTTYKQGVNRINKLIVNRRTKDENIEKVQRVRSRDVDTGRSTTQCVLSI